jgi:hypothetical protein
MADFVLNQVTEEDITPSVDDVALLLRTRTVGPGTTFGGLGADTGPEQVTTFGEHTRPTATEVANVIEAARGSVLGYVRGGLAAIPEAQKDAAKNAIALYAAVLVEVSFFRESVNEELLQLWRDMSNGNVRAVNTAIADILEQQRPTFGSIPMTTGRAPRMQSPVDEAGI